MRARRRSRARARIARLENAPRGVYVLPNLVTTAGLFCGIYAITQAIDGAYVRAALAIIRGTMRVMGRVSGVMRTVRSVHISSLTTAGVAGLGPV